MRIAKIISLSLPVLYVVHAVASQPFNIHGEVFHCRDWSKITNAANSNNQVFFAGWNEEDFALSRNLVRSCHRQGYGGDYETADERIAEIDRFQANTRARAEAREAAKRKQQLVAQEAERREAEKRDRENREQQERERKALNAKCMATTQHALFLQQELVIDDREAIQFARQRLSRERRIGEISGTVDLSIQHDAGEMILEKTEALADDFREYKKLGGHAATPEAVRHTLTNPCPE